MGERVLISDASAERGRAIKGQLERDAHVVVWLASNARIGMIGAEMAGSLRVTAAIVFPEIADTQDAPEIVTVLRREVPHAAIISGPSSTDSAPPLWADVVVPIVPETPWEAATAFSSRVSAISSPPLE